MKQRSDVGCPPAISVAQRRALVWAVGVVVGGREGRSAVHVETVVARGMAMMPCGYMEGADACSWLCLLESFRSVNIE